MNGKQILLAMVFIVIGAILTIYLYDMFNCIYTDSPIPTAELGTFLVLLIGTASIVVAFRKELGSFGKDYNPKAEFLK